MHPYRKKFSESGVRISKIRTLEDFFEYVPLTTSDEVRDFAKTHEDLSYGTGAREADLTLQLDTDLEDIPYIRVSRQDLRLLRGVLTGFWRMLNIKRGDYVSIYDYSTSPTTFLASGPFTGLLKKGVAEILGCVAVCNDGLPEFVLREIHVLKMVRPRVVFVRRDLLSLLAQRLIQEGISFKELGVEKAVVVSNAYMPTAEEMKAYTRWTRIETHIILQVNSALFLCADCASHKGLHVPTDMYFAEIVDTSTGRPVDSGQPGCLAITNLFSHTVPAIRYVTNIRASMRENRCPCGLEGPRLLPEDASTTAR